MMVQFLKSFKKDDDGAITVDWVVLTAGLVGLAVAIVAALGSASLESSNSISSRIDNIEVNQF